MSWKQLVAEDPRNGKTPVRIANINRQIVVTADPEGTELKRGPRVIRVAPQPQLTAQPIVYPETPQPQEFHDVAPTNFHFDDDEPVDQDIPDQEPEEDQEDEEDPKDQMDGLMEIFVSTESGYTKTEIRIGDVTLPIYGPILQVAEKAKVLNKPIDWSFFRHFRPVHYFITDNPYLFDGVGDCDKSIVFVKLAERSQGAVFGIYAIGDMDRISDDGTKIAFSRENREKFTKALAYAVNTTLEESGALTISRYDLNVNVPERAFITIDEVMDMCNKNGIKLNESESGDGDPEDLERMGSDALADLFNQSEDMVDETDPDSSSFNNGNDDDDGTEEVIGYEVQSIPSRGGSFLANPSNSEPIAPFRRKQ